MAHSPELPAGVPEERRERKRVGSLLGAYYRLDKPDGKNAGNAAVSDPDRPEFDAKQSFEATVSTGQIADILKRANVIDSQTRDLDGDVQNAVYENYNKFIRATDVIKQMNATIEGLEPDLKSVGGSLTSMSSHMGQVEESVAGRSSQIEQMLKQQRLCKKLKVLFALPSTLQRCLDMGAYGQAVDAYCCCVPFLEQHRFVPTFQVVLGEVEAQIGRIRTALEHRILSPELSAEESVKSAKTLMHLGRGQEDVVQDYLNGRTSCLQRLLDTCFVQGVSGTSAEAGETLEGDDVRSACSRTTELYAPRLLDAVEGLQRLCDNRSESSSQGSLAIGEDVLAGFVSARVEDLFDRISGVARQRCPAQILVSCVHSVRDSLRRLHSLMPQLLTKLFKAFLNQISASAVASLFARAASLTIADLVELHSVCVRLDDPKEPQTDEALSHIGRTEQTLTTHAMSALTECQPLLGMLSSDRQACLQFERELHNRLAAFFIGFVEMSQTYAGREPTSVRDDDASLPIVARLAPADLSRVFELEWNGLFALALVRVGRYIESKAMGKVWAVAKEVFASSDADLVPDQAVAEALRSAGEAVLARYVLVCGQRLAHFFRNSMTARSWAEAKAPTGPRLVVEMVLREATALDGQLARVLGNPQRPKSGADRRRGGPRTRDTMELEMERVWARKLQVFALISPDRQGAIVGILRIAFKALYEYLREQTLDTKEGLQQVQVDCAFLGELARDLVEAEDASVLDSLLGEAVASAAQRCAEPRLLDAAVLEGICDEKKRS